MSLEIKNIPELPRALALPKNKYRFISLYDQMFAKKYGDENYSASSVLEMIWHNQFFKY